MEDFKSEDSESYYVGITQKGVGRIREDTPEEVMGLYTNKLRTCLGVILYGEDNQITLIHLDQTSYNANVFKRSTDIMNEYNAIKAHKVEIWRNPKFWNAESHNFASLFSNWAKEQKMGTPIIYETKNGDCYVNRAEETAKSGTPGESILIVFDRKFLAVVIAYNQDQSKGKFTRVGKENEGEDLDLAQAINDAKDKLITAFADEPVSENFVVLIDPKLAEDDPVETLKIVTGEMFLLNAKTGQYNAIGIPDFIKFINNVELRNTITMLNDIIVKDGSLDVQYEIDQYNDALPTLDNRILEIIDEEKEGEAIIKGLNILSNKSHDCHFDDVSAIGAITEFYNDYNTSQTLE